MNQTELKWKIEHTREILDTAIEKKYSFIEVLKLSMRLDRLIEEYVTEDYQDRVLVKQRAGTGKI